MKLNLKTIGLAVAALLGALVLTVALFFVFFPKQAAAREAERRIEAATGRDLSLGDDISVSFWPALGFSVDAVALSNPEGFAADQAFIAADRIVFAVDALALLRGAIEVKQLIFERAQMRLQAKADGAVNWAFPTEQSAPSAETTIEDLRLDDVRLVNSVVSFQGAEGAPLTFQNVDVSLALQSLDAPAHLQAALDYRGERLSIDSTIALPRAILAKGQTPLSARLESGPLIASLDGSFDVATGALAGKLEANGASVRRLLAWFGSPMGEGGGFGAFRIAAHMARAGEQTALTGASFSLDAINASGALTLLNQESGRLRVSGALNIANLDVNPYLPAPTQGDQAGAQVNTAWSNAPLDLRGLRALDANLNLTLGALKFQRMSFADVALNLRVANGAADARLSRIALYQGAGAARLIADGSGATARVAVELDARDIQAEPLLTDAIGFNKIAGRGRLVVSLIGGGASQAALMRSLNGTASFNFNDGQWKGVNLAQVARTVQAALTGAAAGDGGATDFAELAASFRVANGVAVTDDLRLLNPFVRLDGAGLIDIGGQSIDMRIAPRAVRSAQGQGGDASLQGLGVPFRASGPWANVKFAPALGDLVQNELRTRAQEALRNQAPGSPLATLGEALFGRAPTPPATPPESPATTPAPEPTPAPAPRNPLEDIFRRATQPRTPAPEPAPTPTP
jgi:AsmA protein